MSSHSDGRNFVSIRQAVAEINSKVLCGQTDRQSQTDKQTNKPEVVWEQTNTCEKEHKELSWQKSRKKFFAPC